MRSKSWVAVAWSIGLFSIGCIARKEEPEPSVAQDMPWFGIVFAADGTLREDLREPPVPVEPDPEALEEFEAVFGALDDTTIRESLRDVGFDTIAKRRPDDEDEEDGEEAEDVVDGGSTPPPSEFPAQGTCEVTGARLVFGGGATADAPLTFPGDSTAPAPGPNPGNLTGVVDGPIPNTNPQVLRSGTAFEYHSDLNGAQSCNSRQWEKHYYVLVEKATARVIGVVDGAGFGPRVRWEPDDDPDYQGTTQTGPRLLRGGTIYEGTPNRIHWVDTPGYATPARQGLAARFARVTLNLLRSVTYDSSGQAGRVCFSGHVTIVDWATGRPLAAAAAGAMLAKAAPLPGGVNQQELQAAARVLRTPQNQGGYRGQNPDFYDLGCYVF